MTPAETLFAYTEAIAHVEKGLECLKEAPGTRSKGSNTNEHCIENTLSIAEKCLEDALKLIRKFKHYSTQKEKSPDY